MFFLRSVEPGEREMVRLSVETFAGRTIVETDNENPWFIGKHHELMSVPGTW